MVVFCGTYGQPVQQQKKWLATHGFMCGGLNEVLPTNSRLNILCSPKGCMSVVLRQNERINASRYVLPCIDSKPAGQAAVQITETAPYICLPRPDSSGNAELFAPVPTAPSPIPDDTNALASKEKEPVLIMASFFVDPTVESDAACNAAAQDDQSTHGPLEAVEACIEAAQELEEAEEAQEVEEAEEAQEVVEAEIKVASEHAPELEEIFAQEGASPLQPALPQDPMENSNPAMDLPHPQTVQCEEKAEQDAEPPAKRIGLWYYKDWWFLREVDIAVNGKTITGTPIFLHEDTLRVINDTKNYFVPLCHIDYISADNGLA